ncbi:MAG: molybdenum cofactor biosynthesis protein MoaE [Phycisphaerales bacterium]|nr:molybdenum cofactor biosynthesis protein MoaE [Phycisphaerales bacterium]
MTTAPNDLILLTADGIDPAAVRAHAGSASGGECGGVCIFEGRTRTEQHAECGDLIALEYQAYDTMAVEQMQLLAVKVREQWPIGALAIVHRTGRVTIGEASVMIAVACGHRDAAFAACRWLIDTLKCDVPIWKKEIWSNGETSWVDPTAS